MTTNTKTSYPTPAPDAAAASQAGQSQLREVLAVADSQVVMEGAGVPIRRALPSRGARLELVDPFLLLDHFKMDGGLPEGSFPPHPHRGFEIITYFIEGGGSHSDSEGNTGIVHAGGLQRITAGRGIWHGEGAVADASGPVNGLQMWVNLPRARKGIPAGYQGVAAAEIPERQIGDATVRVLVGEGLPTRLDTPAVYYDVRLPAGGKAEVPLPDGFQGFVYVLDGLGYFGSNGLAAKATQVVAIGKSGALPVRASGDGVRCMLGAGQPIREQVRWNGPYVD